MEIGLELRQIAHVLDSKPRGTSTSYEAIIHEVALQGSDAGRMEVDYSKIKSRSIFTVPAYLRIIQRAQKGLLTFFNDASIALLDVDGKLEGKSIDAHQAFYNKIEEFSREYVSVIEHLQGIDADNFFNTHIVKRDYPRALGHYSSEEQALIILHMLSAWHPLGEDLDERYKSALKELQARKLVKEVKPERFSLRDQGIDSAYDLVLKYYEQLDRVFNEIKI